MSATCNLSSGHLSSHPDDVREIDMVAHGTCDAECGATDTELDRNGRCLDCAAELSDDFGDWSEAA